MHHYNKRGSNKTIPTIICYDTPLTDYNKDGIEKRQL